MLYIYESVTITKRTAALRLRDIDDGGLSVKSLLIDRWATGKKVNRSIAYPNLTFLEKAWST